MKLCGLLVCLQYNYKSTVYNILRGLYSARGDIGPLLVVINGTW